MSIAIASIVNVLAVVVCAIAPWRRKARRVTVDDQRSYIEQLELELVQAQISCDWQEIENERLRVDLEEVRKRYHALAGVLLENQQESGK